ncbi:hypothetical protein V6K52_18140 [Knoellia sp. S7-12]|uniref:hypothetical protein n=1 Tax=Knoellia sp. S7-12 TaxID=3126698 RepID=UPI003366387D
MSLVHALRAEGTKQRTVPATVWLMLATAAALAALGPAIVSSMDAARCPPAGCPRDLVRVALTGTWLAQTTVALTGVLAATVEFATQTVVTTVTAVPPRWRVVLAKAVVVAVVTAAATAIGAGVAFGLSRLLADDSRFTHAAGFAPLDLSGPSLRALGGTVAYLVAVALIGLGVGLLLRDTAWATSTVMGLLFSVPVLITFIGDPEWNERLQQVAPTAGLAVQATLGLSELPIGPWRGLLVTTAYAAVLLALGTWAFARRDP